MAVDAREGRRHLPQEVQDLLTVIDAMKASRATRQMAIEQMQYEDGEARRAVDKKKKKKS